MLCFGREICFGDQFTDHFHLMQGITSVNGSLSSAIASAQGKTASARADSVDKVTMYETKYRPLADKYNAWYAWAPTHVHVCESR